MDAALVELLFVYGVVLALGLWQLWSIRRTLRKDREKARRRDEGE
jgi:hypothetical protein